MDRILLSEPCSFDKHLVVMQCYEKEIPAQELEFDRTSFWVQLHGIPLCYMTMDAAEKISAIIGEVSRPTDSKEADDGNFLQVRVSIDLSLPLCRGRLVSLKNEKQTWISFRYERLPNLCHWCGRLTHDDKDCQIWIESEGMLQPDQRQFDPSIYAHVFIPSRKNVITVPSFYSSKKKGTSSTSMECDSSGQAPVNSMVIPPILVTSNQQHSNEIGNPSDTNASEKHSNACSSVTPIKHWLHDMNPTDKGMFNGINSQSIGPDKAIRDFNAQLKDIDGEFSNFNSDEPSMLMPIE